MESTVATMERALKHKEQDLYYYLPPSALDPELVPDLAELRAHLGDKPGKTMHSTLLYSTAVYKRDTHTHIHTHTHTT